MQYAAIVGIVLARTLIFNKNTKNLKKNKYFLFNNIYLLKIIFMKFKYAILKRIIMEVFMSIDISNTLYVPTRNEVKRAGLLLISLEASPIEQLEALKILTTWRSLHTYPIDAFQKTLKRRAKTFGFRDCVLAQRLKRLPSIITKLHRFPDMNLARMQDIGGMRIILPTIKDVYLLHTDLLKSSNKFAHIPKMPPNDYIQTPKKDGYRSIHQIFKYKSKAHPELDGLSIELQIRSKLQHSWATAVETLGVVEKSSFKTGDGSDDFKKFFKLSSALFSIKENANVLEEFADWSEDEIVKEAISLEEKLQIFTKLKGIALTAKHIDTQSTRNHAYHLIELSKKDGVWKVNLFPFTADKLKYAEIMYDALEKETKNNPDIDVVLVSVGDLKAIKKAYPNYFLDTNEFIKDLKLIFNKYRP